MEQSSKGNGLSGLLEDLGSKPPRGRLFGLYLSGRVCVPVCNTQSGIKILCFQHGVFFVWSHLPPVPDLDFRLWARAPSAVFPPQSRDFRSPEPAILFSCRSAGFSFQITWLSVPGTWLSVPVTSLPVTWLPVPLSPQSLFPAGQWFPTLVAMTTSRPIRSQNRGCVCKLSWEFGPSGPPLLLMLYFYPGWERFIEVNMVYFFQTRGN